MKYILFGAGDIGIRALNILGEKNVECFVDNYKHGSIILGKKVISFNELEEIATQYSILITSNNYVQNLEQQLLEANIHNYIIFNKRNSRYLEEVLPHYNYYYNEQSMSYCDILLNYEIDKYRKIAIYGVNEYIHYLILELAILNNLENIVGIIENDCDIEEFYGLPVLKYDDVKGNIDCLIINKKRKDSNIRDKLVEVDNSFKLIDIYDVEKFIPLYQHPELKRYKNIYEGRRIFIVGNGPSLTVKDLNQLYKNNEICFGLNKVHFIYDKTNWRPTYTCLTDSRVIKACLNNIEDLAKESTIFMADKFISTDVQNVPDVQYVHLKSELYEPNMPGFSKDITEGVFWGHTVTYDLALQVAAYMGANEIYLLGIDNNNIGSVTDTRNHFIENYFTTEEEAIYKNVIANFEAMNLAYKKAKLYAEKHGFKIYNATRGGKLEVFDRVNFESLFDN